MMDVGENYHPHFIEEATDIPIKTNLPRLQKLPGAGLRGGQFPCPLVCCSPVSPKGFEEQRAVTLHLLPQVKNHHSVTQAKEQIYTLAISYRQKSK